MKNRPNLGSLMNVKKAIINRFNPRTFEFRLARYEKAMRHEEPTLFDDIIKIIQQHDHIELELR